MDPDIPGAPDNRPGEVKRNGRSDEKTGDNLQKEPEAVDVKRQGSAQGSDIDETWHRAGGKTPGD